MARITRRELGHLALGGVVAAASPALARAQEDWRLGFKTPPKTLDGELERIKGRLPAGLRGTLFRVGPAQFERAGERLGHWFDGDGMVQRFAISGGRIRHRGRFVDTAKRRDEEAAGKFLYSGYGFAPEEAASIRSPDDINAANTNVLPAGDDVWALWEGGSPYRVGPQELETRGRKAFEGPLDGAPFSAHPKREFGGDVWNFGILGRRCVIWQLGGRRQRAQDRTPRAAGTEPHARLRHHIASHRAAAAADDRRRGPGGYSGRPLSLACRQTAHRSRPRQGNAHNSAAL
jgi:carotenoid cleavage dioxygenase-like enzyme